MTPTYRFTRGTVRVLFWGALAVLTGWLFSLALDDRPLCPVRIVSPTQWEWTDTDTPLTPQALAECVAPAYMVLHPDGTWDWITEP